MKFPVTRSTEQEEKWFLMAHFPVQGGTFGGRCRIVGQGELSPIRSKQGILALWQERFELFGLIGKPWHFLEFVGWPLLRQSWKLDTVTQVGQLAIWPEVVPAKAVLPPLHVQLLLGCAHQLLWHGLPTPVLTLRSGVRLFRKARFWNKCYSSYYFWY